MQTINPVLQGLLQGVSIGNMIRQSALQQEAAEREKMRFQHEQQVRDLQTRMTLGNATRPVVAGGMVREELDAALPEFDPANPGTPKMRRTRTAVMRPVDRARLVRYKLPDGETIEGELLSPEDQVQRKLSEAAAIAELRNTAALDQIRGREEILEPGRKRQRDFAAGQAATNREFQTTRDAANRAHQVSLAKENNAARERMNDADNAAATQRLSWSERVAKGREERAAQRDAETAEKEVRKQEAVIQTRLDALQKSEAAIHAKRRTVGARGTQLGKDQPSNWKKDLEKLKAEMAGLDQQLESINQQKTELLGRKKSLRPEKAPAGDLYSRYGL